MNYKSQINYNKGSHSLFGIGRVRVLYFDVEYSPADGNGLGLADFTTSLQDYPRGVLEVNSQDNIHIVRVQYSEGDITEEAIIDWVKEIFK